GQARTGWGSPSSPCHISFSWCPGPAFAGPDPARAPQPPCGGAPPDWSGRFHRGERQAALVLPRAGDPPARVRDRLRSQPLPLLLVLVDRQAEGRSGFFNVAGVNRLVQVGDDGPGG